MILSDQYHWSLSVTLIALACPQVHARTHTCTHLTCTHSESLLIPNWNTESVCRIQMLNMVPIGSEFCTFMWYVLGKLTPYSLCFVMKHGFYRRGYANSQCNQNWCAEHPSLILKCHYIMSWFTCGRL